MWCFLGAVYEGEKMGFTDIFKIKEFKAEIEQLRQENQSLLSKNETAHKQLSDLGCFVTTKSKKKQCDLKMISSKRKSN